MFRVEVPNGRLKVSYYYASLFIYPRRKVYEDSKEPEEANETSHENR